MNWLLNVAINDISVIQNVYVKTHRCAGGLKKKLDIQSGSQRHRHFVGWLFCVALAIFQPYRDLEAGISEIVAARPGIEKFLKIFVFVYVQADCRSWYARAPH